MLKKFKSSAAAAMLGAAAVMSSAQAAVPDNADIFYYNLADQFISSFSKTAEKAALAANIKLKAYNAADDAFLQSQQLDTRISDKKNSAPLFVNLVDFSYGLPLAQAAKANPAQPYLVFFNRPVSKDALAAYDKAWYVSTDARESGSYQAEILIEYLQKHPEADRNKNGEIEILMLKGESTHTDALLRTQTVIDKLNASGIKYRIVYSANANWDFQQAFASTEQAIARLSLNNIEAVVANNDAMALGAVTALNQYDYNLDDKGDKYLPVVGIDAIDNAITAIREGRMLGTVCNDAARISEVMFTIVSMDTADEQAVSKQIGLPVENRTVMVPYRKVKADL